MATASPQPQVPLSSLQLGEKLGSGGQGDVYHLHNRPGTVFKLYRAKNASAPALMALVDFPGTLNPGARHSLLSQTAWPHTCVTDGPVVAGFLMDEVPGKFFGRVANGHRQLRELQYLLYPPKALWGDITPLDATGRIQVADAFVRLVQLMHEHSIVLGDISMRNLLWCAGQAGQPAQIFLVDCDSAGRIGLPPVLPQPQTWDWDDPQMPSAGPDLDTDRYKVALAVGRILAARHDIRPGEEWTPVAGIPAEIAGPVKDCFAEAARMRNGRPEVSRWVQALSGREMIQLSPLRPLPPPGPQLPQVPLDGSEQRGTILLTTPTRRPVNPPDPQLPQAPLEGSQRGQREFIDLKHEPNGP